MENSERYQLTFERSPADRGERTEDVVVVHRTDAKGPGGYPVYCDDTGILRAEISERGEVRMLASGGHQTLRPPAATRVVE
ncbi:DUF6296 family protein [Wenjunlia tyrosinilytica]|jgi:hypothetical protein|uniref:Uncharacterized protein n=1 Tax=Wenjunlia tyrosinilytica TaxID=1544741 RepID=A0A917ZQS8_9ACTN|nr:DUF6296 family protein [Wenjunlia tyrosinilytica]GGO87978.1 hypothetical protein GCM10012280_27710 [Wenjunlia tyrosinilytica]